MTVKITFVASYDFKKNTCSLAKEQKYQKVERGEEKTGAAELVKLRFKSWPLSGFPGLVMLFYKWHSKALWGFED